MEQQDLKDLWNNLQVNVSEKEVENSLKQLLARISLYEELFSAKRKATQKNYSILKIAGILLLPVLASFFTYLSFNNRTIVQESIISYTEYVAPMGERREVVLEDDTRVYLNSGSVLIAPKKFIDKNRIIYLIGEGYFKVASNKEKPFRVKTSLIEIEALGTEFSVSAYSQDNSVQVILTEGSVRLSTLDTPNSQSIIMSPNHQSVYNPQINGFIVNEVNASRYTSWKEGILIFDKTPISDVLRRIEIQYGVQISYDKSNTNITRHNITAKFIQNESLEDILNALSNIINFKYQIIKNQVIIK
ncbi:FecR family protein [Parabacteroides bouchesdurhonensis]|uniref:FecR family protein n=1 Tax=Parabacteroides bouchesdurhonensis TaxID=1936995 RepID=UPI000C85970D|nr:FecR family protein [Parabacteroides bouchesdurhonensis]